MELYTNVVFLCFIILTPTLLLKQAAIFLRNVLYNYDHTRAIANFAPPVADLENQKRGFQGNMTFELSKIICQDF
jgi:hypothetical protein